MAVVSEKGLANMSHCWFRRRVRCGHARVAGCLLVRIIAERPSGSCVRSRSISQTPQENVLKVRGSGIVRRCVTCSWSSMRYGAYQLCGAGDAQKPLGVANGDCCKLVPGQSQCRQGRAGLTDVAIREAARTASGAPLPARGAGSRAIEFVTVVVSKYSEGNRGGAGATASPSGPRYNQASRSWMSASPAPSWVRIHRID